MPMKYQGIPNLVEGYATKYATWEPATILQ